MRGAGVLAAIPRFAGVGLATTLLDIALFSGLVAAGAMPGPANVLSFSCGIAVSYSLHRRWTFRASGSRLQAAKFVVSTLAGLTISTVLLTFLSTLASPIVAKIVTVPLIFLWNFGAARLWVFADKPAPLPPRG